MTATRSSPATKAWTKAFAHPSSEFSATPLPILSGHIPHGLRGSLYRNGAARLERGGVKVGHWFDGDGAILAVHFTDAGATGIYQYVKTAEYLAETAVDAFLYSNYGMTAPGPIWNRWFRPFKNAANTSVLALSNRLLALWEGGQPHALDLQTLQTLDLDALGALENDQPYSAHPKRDAHTGEIFNFGITPGRNATLNLYRSQVLGNGDRPGTIHKKVALPLKGVPLIHDFVLAGQYLVFCIPPVRMNTLLALLGLSSFSDSLIWKPELGTQILIIDRETLAVVGRSETEPWYQWHFSNGYVGDDGDIVIDLVRYPDFQTNQYLKEVPTGQLHTDAQGTLWQLRLDPHSGRVKTSEELLDRSCEFPVVPPHQVGRAAPSSYMSLHRRDADVGQDLFGAIARFDPATRRLTEANLGENRYPSEPIYAPDPENPDHGWVITVVFDGNINSSEVWIFDSDRLDTSPLARLALPSVIPFSFHGTWKG